MGEYDTGTGTTDTSSSTAESETTARTGATGTGYDAQSASLRPTEANVQYEAGVDIDADADVDADAAADAQDAFMSRPYAVTDFVPSTGMGKFDAFYDPVAGQLTITVKVHFDYTLEAGASMGERLEAWWNEEDGWTEQEKADFESGFLARVTDRWSGKHTIVCTKPGWNIAVTPTVRALIVQDADAAHYAVTVHKEASSMGPGSPRPTPTTMYEDNTDIKHADQSVTEAEHDRLAALMQPMPAEGRDDEIRALGSKMAPLTPSTPLLEVSLNAWGDSVPDAWDEGYACTQKAARLLAEGGAPQRLSPDGWGSNAHGTISFAVESATQYHHRGGDRANRDYVSHEFGHMLGLPDEYEHSHHGGDDDRERYQALVESAGVRMPLTDTDTTSIMSKGSDVIAAHYATIWEALYTMTSPTLGPSDWSL